MSSIPSSMKRALFAALMTTLLLSSGAYGVRFSRYTNRSGFYSDSIDAIAVKGSVVWVASTYAMGETAAGGVSRFVPGQNSTNFGEDVLGSIYVNTIVIRDREVWFGTRTGVKIYDTSDKSWTTIRDELPEIDAWAFAFVGESVYVGTSGGLTRLDADRGVQRNYGTADGLPVKQVRSLYVLGEELWIGTSNGVAVLDLTTDAIVRTYGVEDGLVDGRVLSVVLDEGTAWVGTEKGGCRLDFASGEWTTIMREGKELPPSVREIALTESGVALATNMGLAIYDEEKDNWKWFDRRNGLQSDDVTCVASNGFLWAGTGNGLIAVKSGIRIGIVPMLAIVVVAAVGLVYVGVRKGKLGPKPDAREARRAARPRKRVRAELLCKGEPKLELCEKCNWNTLKGDRLFCRKYNKYCE